MTKFSDPPKSVGLRLLHELDRAARAYVIPWHISHVLGQSSDSATVALYTSLSVGIEEHSRAGQKTSSYHCWLATRSIKEECGIAVLEGDHLTLWRRYNTF